MNRTGIGTSPIDSEDIVKTAVLGCPLAERDGKGVAAVRQEYENDAEPLGTVPIPSTLKGAFKTAVEMVRGRKVTALVDKLGERLAFERTGVRLYEALITKFDTTELWRGAPTRAELEQFHDEEQQHFDLLRVAMHEVGADFTAETPGADVAGLAAGGILQVITDPRTTLAQSLSALLTLELSDNDGWRLLADLAHHSGEDKMLPGFEQAQQEEACHVSHVRSWVSAEALAEVKHEAKAG
jgi:hypothetical protein